MSEAFRELFPDAMSSSRLGLLVRRQRFPDPQNSIGRSVNTDCEKLPRWEPGELCWEPSGAALDAYNSFRPTIKTLLDQQCEEVPEKAGLILGLYMIGFSSSTAAPVLVLVCKNRYIAKEAQKIIKKSKILDGYPGFRTALMSALPTGELVLLAAEEPSGNKDAHTHESLAVYFDPTDPIRVIAMSIIIKPSEGPLRRATANAIYHDKKYGYFTAAHAFHKGLHVPDTNVGWGSDAEMSSGDEDDCNEEELRQLSQHSMSSHEESLSDQSSTSAESLERVHFLGSGDASVTHTSQSHLVGPQDSGTHIIAVQNDSSSFSSRTISEESHNLELMGHLLMSSASKDWAVVHVSNAQVIRALEEAERLETATINGIAPNICHASAVAYTARGPVVGIVSGAPILLRFPQSNTFAEAFPFRCDNFQGGVEMGDCGTFVVDQHTKELFGHVIAGSRVGSSTTAYIMAAYHTMDELSSQHDWQLLRLQPRGGESPLYSQYNVAC